MTATGTLSIVKQKSSPTPEIGDIIQGGEYLAELLEEDVVEKIRAHGLSLVHENHWTALERLGVDVAELVETVEYQCPFNPGAIFYHIYPIYISRLYPNEVTDFYRIMVEEEPENDSMIQPPFIDDIDRSFLGHGYTSYILPHDGGGKWRWAKVELSDERWLLVAYFEWYNK